MLITRYGCLLYLLNSCIKVASFFSEDFISHKLFVKKKTQILMSSLQIIKAVVLKVVKFSVLKMYKNYFVHF